MRWDKDASRASKQHLFFFFKSFQLPHPHFATSLEIFLRSSLKLGTSCGLQIICPQSLRTKLLFTHTRSINEGVKVYWPQRNCRRYPEEPLGVAGSVESALTTYPSIHPSTHPSLQALSLLRLHGSIYQICFKVKLGNDRVELASSSAWLPFGQPQDDALICFGFVATKPCMK